jgi:glutamine synthetase
MKLAVAALLVGSAAAFAPVAFNPRQSSSLSAELLSKQTGISSLDPSVIASYASLGLPADKILAEYVWVDAEGGTRSKTRTLPAAKGESVDKLPKWNFDGSSTGQAPGDDSEVILRPVRIFRDPFRPRSDGVDNILVMCDCYTPAGDAIESNTRAVGEYSHFSCSRNESSVAGTLAGRSPSSPCSLSCWWAGFSSTSNLDGRYRPSP